MKKSKYKDYVLITIITLLILLLIFLIKGIYPLGNNTLIYGDMYDQITSYYYYFYDSIKGPQSLLINFSASNGINFFGIIFYYLASPLSLLILLIERSKIHLFISIIIALKILICNLTCSYMLKNLFKSANSLIIICLSLLYGFSAYSLNYYQITSWIESMYMLPIIIVGLNKLFNENNSKLYIISLALSLYFSFYISFMVIIFIFLLSGIYLYNYHKKEQIPQKILSLGISTILSIGISLIAIIPTYKQISISARMISSLETLINSKFGPLTDKIALLLSGPILFVGILLMIKNYKIHKKFLKFYIPSMCLLLTPIVIEPTNKILHFGSYASFPYRFGFITTLFTIIGAAYYFSKYKFENEKINKPKVKLSILISSLAISIMVFLTKLKYLEFQKAIDSLTLSRNKMLIIILIIMFVLTFLTCFTIIILNKKQNKYAIIFVLIISIAHIICNSYLYLGIDFIKANNNYIYNILNKIENDKITTIFRLKDETNSIINNSSNVTKIPSIDHFSSLTDNQTQKTLKLLGYSSYWTHTHSKGGTLFTDILLGNKYLLNTTNYSENYDLIKKYDNFYLHELNKNISYGYIINNNIDIYEYKNTFEIQNAIYNTITSDNNLFEIVNDLTYHNIEKNNNNYKIIDKSKDNYIEFNIKSEFEKSIYLELYKSIDNSLNNDIYKLFNIYINNELFIKNYPTDMNNGLVNFGTHKNINIKIEFLEDCYLESLNIGMLNIQKLNDFINNYQNNIYANFNENKINIKIDSNTKKTLFIPISNNESYEAYNNGKKIKLENIYNTYIGIKLNQGSNNIIIKFFPKYLKISILISLLTAITTITIIKTNIYEKISNNKILQKIAKYIYLIIYALAIIGIYLLPILIFFISLVTYIHT